MPLVPPQSFRKTEFIHRIGLAAARPAAADVLVGTLYFSTDTLVLERSDGIIWSTYSPTGSGSPIGQIGPPGIDGIDGEDGYGMLFSKQQINFNDGVIGILPVVSGGTGLATVLANNLLTGNGIGALTAETNLTYDGTSFVIGTAGPHAIGTTTGTSIQLHVGGTFNPVAGGFILLFDTISIAAVNNDFYGLYCNPQLTEAASGTHGIMTGAYFSLTPTAGAAATLTMTTVRVAGFTAPAGTTVAATLHIVSAPSGAANNYSLFCEAGNVRIDDGIALGGGLPPVVGTIGGSGPGTAAQNQWLRIYINGVPNFIPVWQ